MFQAQVAAGVAAGVQQLAAAPHKAAEERHIVQQVFLLGNANGRCQNVNGKILT